MSNKWHKEKIFLTHTSLNVGYLTIYVCVCVYVGQSPYHDNDQGVCWFPLVSRVERQELSLG